MVMIRRLTRATEIRVSISAFNFYYRTSFFLTLVYIYIHSLGVCRS